MEKKITKRMILEAIRTVAENGNVDFGDAVSADDVINYVDATITQLDNKAAKAKEKAAEKKIEGDALRAAIESLLTNDFQTIDAIAAAIKDPDVTKSKVTARLTQLVKAGLAHKSQIKTEDGRKIMAYAAGPAPVAEVEPVEVEE